MPITSRLHLELSTGESQKARKNLTRPGKGCPRLPLPSTQRNYMCVCYSIWPTQIRLIPNPHCQASADDGDVAEAFAVQNWDPARCLEGAVDCRGIAFRILRSGSRIVISPVAQSRGMNERALQSFGCPEASWIFWTTRITKFACSKSCPNATGGGTPPTRQVRAIGGVLPNTSNARWHLRLV